MPSRSTTGVLVSIKVLQLVGSIICMVLHIVLYLMEPSITPHITVFCGTFMGFTLVNLSFLISAAMGKPAAEELDMALGVLGGVLFYTCGILSMFFVKKESKKDKEVGQLYFDLSRAQAMASLLTALIFVFDACLKFDMWNYERNKRKRNKILEEEPPVLRLFCVDMGAFCYKKCRCCKCCDACCDKCCRCCRPQEEESESDGSNISRRSSVSRKSNAPTITVEKYQDKRDTKDNVVVQRVEIEWLPKPERFTKATGEERNKEDPEKIEENEDIVSPTPSMTAASFLFSQKMTWPLPLQSMVPAELSLSSRLRHIKDSEPATKPLRSIASTSSCPISLVPSSAVPTVSFQHEDTGRISTIIHTVPSTALTSQTRDSLRIEEEVKDNAKDVAEDVLKEIVGNVSPEESIVHVEDVLNEIVGNVSPEESIAHVEAISSIEDPPHVEAISTIPTSEVSLKSVRSRIAKKE